MSLISRSARCWSGVSTSNRYARTSSTCPRAAESSRSKPASVSSANWPRLSVGHALRRTHPASSMRATAWLSLLREDIEFVASSLIRSLRSGASDSRTRISK